MSDPNLKGVKRTSVRQTSSAKNRSTTGKSPRPSPLVKRSTTEKAPARKAAKAAHASAKTKAAKQSAKVSTTAARKPVASKSGNKQTTASTSKSTKKAAAAASASKKRLTETKPKQIVAAPAVAAPRRPSAPTPPPPVVHRQPTRDEAAALRAFERAHKEFARGRFSEARSLFRALIEQHAGVSEVTARARTYLAIAETRLRTEPILPRDADSLYDRGVIELNRGEFVAAQELFERALKREPEAAHVHYGMAATRARLGSVSSAIESLRRALELQPRLRVRAQHDQDLAALRNDPEFDTLIFAPRS